MSKKRDMYIDYKKSYKRRGRRGPRWYWIGLIIILGIGLCIAAIYSIQAWRHHQRQESNESNGIISSIPSKAITMAPTDTPTPLPTATPTPTVMPLPTPTEEAKEVEAATWTGRNAVKVKGIYVTSQVAASANLSKLIEIADTTEINAMVIDIKDDYGKISYQMDSAIAKEIGATTNTISDIKKLMKELKDREIYLIARIVAFKDPYLAEQRQELAIKNKDGTLYRDNNGEGWVNPYNKKVWKYLVDVASQAAGVGFDEIQFDYIRFSTGIGISNVDFGKAALNKSKEDIILEFTKYAYEKLKPLGVYVSADVYGTIISSSVDAARVGQNYVEMAKYLDYICPMIYPSHFGEGNYGIDYPDTKPYETIRKVLTASREKLGQIPEEEHCAIVRPWLQDFTASWLEHHITYGSKELREQINGVYSVEYEEWLLWNAACRYSVEGLLKE
jgi:hypothetical protein